MANRSVAPVADRPQTPRPPLAGPYGPAQAQRQGTSPSLGSPPPSPAKAVPPHAAPRGQPPHPALLGGHHRRRPASPQARPGRTEPAPAPGTEPRGVGGEKGPAQPRPPRRRRAQRALPAAPRAPHLPRAGHAPAPSRKWRPTPLPPLVVRHFRPVRGAPAPRVKPLGRAGGGAAHARGGGWGAGREACGVRRSLAAAAMLWGAGRLPSPSLRSWARRCVVCPARTPPWRRHPPLCPGVLEGLGPRWPACPPEVVGRRSCRSASVVTGHRQPRDPGEAPRGIAGCW